MYINYWDFLQDDDKTIWDGVIILGQYLIAPSRETGLFRYWYRNIYLRSNHWKSIRDEAIEAAGHCCQLCDYRFESLDIHHLNYDRLGKEKPEDIMVVCRDCHNEIHVAPTRMPKKIDGRSMYREQLKHDQRALDETRVAMDKFIEIRREKGIL